MTGDDQLGGEEDEREIRSRIQQANSGTLTEALDELDDPYTIAPAPLTDGQDDVVNDLVSRTGKLENGLRNALTAAEKTGIQTHRNRGRFDTRAAGRMKAGETSVFKKRWAIAKHCTAVALVFDHSSSMDHRQGNNGAQPSRRQTAQALEIAAGRTFAKAQIPFSIIRYTDRVYVTKTAQQRFSPAQLSANAHGQWVNGYTDTTASILAAEQTLRGVDATRKMILVITDGGCNRGPLAVAEACGYVRARGIDQVNCIAIDGILDDDGYNHSIALSADTLATEGLKVLAAY